MIVKHKNTWQALFRWKGRRYRRGFGYATDMNLNMAKKYIERLKEIRAQCKANKIPLPELPPAERIPCLGKIIQTYKAFSQSESLPMDLFFALIERAKQRNLTEEQSLQYLAKCEANYKKLITEKRLKAAQAKAKRAATIAAKKASKASSAYAAAKHLP
jgi:hypothetical protein